jgi:hypothetical protein
MTTQKLEVALEIVPLQEISPVVVGSNPALAITGSILGLLPFSEQSEPLERDDVSESVPHEFSAIFDRRGGLACVVIIWADEMDMPSKKDKSNSC